MWHLQLISNPEHHQNRFWCHIRFPYQFHMWLQSYWAFIDEVPLNLVKFSCENLFNFCKYECTTLKFSGKTAQCAGCTKFFSYFRDFWLCKALWIFCGERYPKFPNFQTLRSHKWLLKCRYQKYVNQSHKTISKNMSMPNFIVLALIVWSAEKEQRRSDDIQTSGETEMKSTSRVTLDKNKTIQHSNEIFSEVVVKRCRVLIPFILGS